MICPSCQSDVPIHGNYCTSCGASLDSRSDAPTILSDDPTGSPARQNSAASSTEDTRFLPGTVIAKRYRIVGLLGKGGMGEVYRADDLKLNQPVAIKLLPEDLQEGPDRLERFINEVRMARQVSHSNVCRVYDVYEVDSIHFISMEYVDGEDLSSLLRRIGHLPRDKAVQIARQLCAGLAAAHERGILHRDLKPANIMIDGRGRVRITDFGLAGLEREIQGSEAPAGTPAYMAPEQLEGAQVTTKSDLYSLGLVLYEIFTGRSAFKAKTLADLTRLQKESSPPSPSTLVHGFDPVVERIILRCLEKDPRMRPASALAVSASLPGGDPLAEALAAGETPSPEMVAEAGGESGLKPLTGLICLVGFIIALVLTVALSERIFLSNVISLELSAEELALRAKDIIGELDWKTPATDAVSGFGTSQGQLLYLENSYEPTKRGAGYSSVRPTPIWFWYRQSPEPLVPTSFAGFVTPGNPPNLLEGMITLHLDAQGRLLRLSAVPPEKDETSVETQEPDWSLLFRQAGLETSDFQSTQPIWNPFFDCDMRKAWSGHYPGQADIPVRAEAGSYRGQIIYFRTILPWTPEFKDRGTNRRGQPRALFVLYVALALGLLTGTLLIARHNIRQGRGDRKGSFRIAYYISLVSLSAWVLRANHVAGLEELGLIAWATGECLLLGTVVWLMYMALEPYVRRHWPNSLITWNRFLAGRFRDPLIGRDILVGALAGSLIGLGMLMIQFLPAWLGSGSLHPVTGLQAIAPGIGDVISLILLSQTNAVVNPLAMFLLILVLRVLVRKQWLAVLLVFAIFTAFSTLSNENPAVGFIVYCLVWLLLLFVLIRFGIFAAVLTFLFANLPVFVPLTSNLSRWNAGHSLLVMGVLLALVGYGFYISLSGRPLFTRKLLPD